MPDHFVIARHTFFDFGPPNDYYELLLVRPLAKGTSVERVTLTPAADAGLQPAKVEIASATMTDSVVALLGGTNPCAIPQKELRRELKRCKKCLVFSGANVTMQVRCGAESRIIRSDILDRDLFDPAPNTPKNTSWTMDLLARLDRTLGPGVMDKPMFPIADANDSPSGTVDASETLLDIGSGKYDGLFVGAPDKPSDLYRAAQIHPPTPTIRLLSSSPIAPKEFPMPKYPPLARLAHVQGRVVFKVDIDPKGVPSNFTLVTGNPILSPSVKMTLGDWRFPKEAVGQ